LNHQAKRLNQFLNAPLLLQKSWRGTGTSLLPEIVNGQITQAC
jgi:hypothetical protein